MPTLRKAVTLSLLVALLLAALPATTSTAQESGTLVYDEPVEGTITDQAFAESWPFEALAADRIRVRAERLDGNLIPDVNVLDLSGKVIARSSGADDTRARALVREFKLPGPGRYEVVVGRDRGETGLTTGSYRLTVELLGLAQDHPDNQVVIGEVAYDTPVSGAISAQHWYHIYTLNGEEGDLVRVMAQRQSGMLMPRVELQDLNGQSLRTGNMNAQGVQASFDSYALPNTGEYRVIVYRERGIDGDTTGAYELTVILMGSGENSARLNVPPNTIEAYGETQQGTITHAQWHEDWTLQAEAADLITIIVTRTPGNNNVLQPQVILQGAAGQDLTRANVDSTGTTATISRYRLAAPGSYTVRVQRDRGKSGATVGEYELRVILEGSGVGSAALQPVTGALETGVPVEGAITNTRWADKWSYTGQADEQIDIEVLRTDGTLVPRIEIVDANGQSLRTASAEQTADSAFLTNYRLPAAAEYFIVVQRDRGQDGTTTGSYSLTISPTPQ